MAVKVKFNPISLQETDRRGFLQHASKEELLKVVRD